MITIKGPGIFLAQFMGDKPPFNNMKTICQWAKTLGFVGVQIPTWDTRCIDLQKEAENHLQQLRAAMNDSILKEKFTPFMSSAYECAQVAENILAATIL